MFKLIYHYMWKKNLFYLRDFMSWNLDRKYNNWLKFAKKHALYVNITHEFIKDRIK